VKNSSSNFSSNENKCDTAKSPKKICRKINQNKTNYVILEDKLPIKVMAKKISKVSEPAVAVYQKAHLSVQDILRVDFDWLDEPLSRVDTFRNGLHKSSFESFKELSGLDYNTLADALGVSAKTLQRKEVFDTGQSEKLYELAELYAIGINYFGREGFRRWMERPLFSIGNRIPLDLIDVSAGLDILKAEIIRLQHGIAI
jgi:putative toxin-antitoxin system antitoxin component (TIGR02293 family)